MHRFVCTYFLVFIKVLIVDDGSTDRTSKVAFEYVKRHSIDNVRVLLLGRNHGKGEAVRKVSVELPTHTLVLIILL
jgi:dolichyl-phosphate beta-glucosyltransferase